MTVFHHVTVRECSVLNQSINVTKIWYDSSTKMAKLLAGKSSVSLDAGSSFLHKGGRKANGWIALRPTQYFCCWFWLLKSAWVHSTCCDHVAILHAPPRVLKFLGQVACQYHRRERRGSLRYVEVLLNSKNTMTNPMPVTHTQTHKSWTYG